MTFAAGGCRIRGSNVSPSDNFDVSASSVSPFVAEARFAPTSIAAAAETEDQFFSKNLPFIAPVQALKKSLSDRSVKINPSFLAQLRLKIEC